jgi:alcohol-forming fatty acyl-CoA reductase
MEEICIASDSSNDVNDERPTIAQFLAGKNVFITGGTGFLGTLLIERLLSATPELGKVYVLIRSKNGYSAESRIERMMSKVVSTICSEHDCA